MLWDSKDNDTCIQCEDRIKYVQIVELDHNIRVVKI